MNNLPAEKPRLLFLFSDTGGGHRSAAEAIIEALQSDYGDALTTRMVDIFKDYAPPPFNRFPRWYPRFVLVPQAWEIGYHITDGHNRARLLTSTFWPYVRRAAHKLIEQNPADLIVSVHPVANAPILRALGKTHPPYISVVTDLVTVHALAYHRRVNLCVVPTEAARERALSNGMRPDQVIVVGLPVAERFCQPTGDRQALRLRLGWPLDLPVAVLMGGGDGMGPLKSTAQTIAASGLPLAMAIVTGRNANLKARLEAINWPLPTFIYGFVNEMPDFMRAADILVTKAGPGTVCEAINAGLPMILYSRLPGQEDGNVDYVVSEGAGIWAPNPERIVSALWDWIYHPEKRSQAAANCRRIANPRAAHQIAEILARQVKIGV